MSIEQKIIYKLPDEIIKLVGICSDSLSKRESEISKREKETSNLLEKMKEVEKREAEVSIKMSAATHMISVVLEAQKRFENEKIELDNLRICLEEREALLVSKEYDLKRRFEDFEVEEEMDRKKKKIKMDDSFLSDFFL
jgi:hypothetical protein